MVYPSDPPVAKHDIVSAAHVSVSRMEPSETPQEFLADGRQNAQSFPKKIATIYTYSDDPIEPKPMSKTLPICGFCSLESIGVSSTFMEPSLGNLKTCRIGVKRADDKYKKSLQNNPSAITNSNNFALLIQQLRRNDKTAFFKCPTTERAGFIVPIDDTIDGSDYVAYCLVGSMEDVKKSIDGDDGNGSGPEVDFSMNNEAEPSDNFGNKNEEQGLWKPPTGNDDDNNDFETSTDNLWTPSTPPGDNQGDGFFSSEQANDNDEIPDYSAQENQDGDTNENEFHTDDGAAAADKFYSTLTRSLGTRADSMLYHMRNFNGWVKATQIAELDPNCIEAGGTTKKRKRTKHPLRVLDLACGKGGDLGKWVLHKRKIGNYVGVDVARGSLVDAAVRARKMRNLDKCVFTCADLGSDVPGRLKSQKHQKMQKLLSWSMASDNGIGDPEFSLKRGGGIEESDKFDVVSIQFAIHYMMSSIHRARRFFHTVSQLLEIGGNLIATTIDARKVMEHMMNTGFDFSFDKDSGLSNLKKDSGERLVVAVGKNACQLKFTHDILKRIFHPSTSHTDGDNLNPDFFGLEYTFTLVEGEDHAAGVGQAVDLPEWLIPLPVLCGLAKEAGLVLEDASNFHDFYTDRRDPNAHHAAHSAMYNMKVLNRSGTISEQEWEISGMYMAVKFRKERESTLDMDAEESANCIDESSDEEMEDDRQNTAQSSTAASSVPIDMNDPKAKKFFVLALSKAKKSCGDGWASMNGDERKIRINDELEILIK